MSLADGWEIQPGFPGYLAFVRDYCRGMFTSLVRRLVRPLVEWLDRRIDARIALHEIGRH